MKNKIILLISLLLCVSCAPTTFTPFQPPELKFEKTPNFSNQDNLDKIRNIGTIQFNPLYMNNDYKQVDPNVADFVCLSRQEYKGIGVLIEKTKAYKQLSVDEAGLINIDIDTINSYKEYISLERQKAIEYRELWVNAKNDYLQEQYRHDRDNLYNKISQWLIVIGGIVLGAHAL